MLTRWGRDLDPDAPLPEYPRPRLRRGDETWVNLNGRWHCAFTDTDARPATWTGEIVVPFSPEAPLSGVGRQLRPDEWLWYRRTLTCPEPPARGRVLVHFGAVDQSCTVWVDEIEVGAHTGGYLPFTLDITDAVGSCSRHRAEHELVVRVRDLSETGPHARGKQRLDRGEIWYTAQSGIWQTVWIEVVPAEYVTDLVVTPDLASGVLEVEVAASAAPIPSVEQPASVEPAETTPSVEPTPIEPAEIHVLVRDGGAVVAEATGPCDRPLRLQVPDPRTWSPDDPHLYDLEVRLGEDRVTSYAAMRSVGTGIDAHGRRCFLLNGKPFQHVGVLDQGYWPDGLLTPPSDAAMVHDLTTMKSLGFTMLRKHVKVEPQRWYHHCDRLGLLVWQDMVNGGGRYRHLVTQLPARRPVRLSDRHHRLFFRDDATARAEFRDEVRRTVALLRSTACVAVWVPFNEGWGQFDADEIAAEIAALDPTRPICQVSGWIDQGGGDVRGHHSYLRPFRLPRRARRDHRVQALTEYGGYSLVVDGHDWSSREFGYRHCDDAADLAEAFAALHRDVVAPVVRTGIAATVYTQVSDVEDELNGLLTWDREVLKVPAATVREMTDLIRAAATHD